MMMTATATTSSLIQVANDLESCRETLAAHFNNKVGDEQQNPFNLLRRLRLLQNNVATLDVKLKTIEEARNRLQGAVVQVKLREGMTIPEFDALRESLVMIGASSGASSSSSGVGATTSSTSLPRVTNGTLTRESTRSTTTMTTMRPLVSSSMDEEIRRATVMTQVSMNEGGNNISGSGSSNNNNSSGGGRTIVSESEFMKLPISTRGRAKYEEVNEVAKAVARLCQSSHHNGNLVSLTTLDSLGLKVFGHTGDAVLASLRALDVIVAASKDKVGLTKSKASVLL